MMCPECGGDTKVVETRFGIDDLRCRRRECLECGCRFSTVEINMDVYKKLRPPNPKAIFTLIDKAFAILKTDMQNALEEHHG